MLQELVGDLRIEDMVADMRLGLARKPLGDAAAEILRRKAASAQPRVGAGEGKEHVARPDAEFAVALLGNRDELERDGARGERFKPAADFEIGLQPVRPRLLGEAQRMLRGRRRRCRRHWCGR